MTNVTDISATFLGITRREGRPVAEFEFKDGRRKFTLCLADLHARINNLKMRGENTAEEDKAAKALFPDVVASGRAA